MIWSLFSAIILRPLDDKLTVEEGKDYFFRLIGESEKNYGNSYLDDAFYIVSDFIKDQERYLHLVYLGNFSNKIRKDDEEFLIENTNGSSLKIENVQSFSYFKFARIPKWLLLISTVLAILFLIGLIYFIINFLKKKRERKKSIQHFFKKYTRLDFEDIVVNRIFYEKLLKKDLSSLVAFIKENFFIKEWSEDFINECRKKLSNLKK